MEDQHTITHYKFKNFGLASTAAPIIRQIKKAVEQQRLYCCVSGGHIASSGRLTDDSCPDVTKTKYSYWVLI